MKKVFLLATAALLFAGTSFAHNGNCKKGKKCSKGKSCCSKSSKSHCKKDKSKTANL